MLLVTSGCSHSVIYPEKENLPYTYPHLMGIPLDEWSCDVEVEDPWPYKLARKMNAELINLSNEGKDNRQIFNDTIAFLSDPNQPTPDALVIQWTELSRLCIFKQNHTKKWEATNRPHNNNFMLPHWVKIGARRNKEGASTKELFRRINLYNLDGTLGEFMIFSENYTVEKIELIHMTYVLQMLCEARKIKLCVVPFFETNEIPEHYWLRVDPNIFLIANIQESQGWADHLLWEGYEPFWHNHYQDDAQDYTAECIKEFLNNGVQTYVSRMPYPNKTLIHRYCADDV